MSDKAYVIRLFDTDAVHKLATWLEQSTSDISSLRGIYVLTTDDFFEAGSPVVLISADREDLRKSVEIEFHLGKWNSAVSRLENFVQFFDTSTEIIRNSSISDRDFLIESIKII
jgi:hypothetical protein